ncbi:MAG: NINE protein [Saprospiraceae bacterium]|nr:NINE protein [Saprospiraceae bacterium]
MQPKSRITAAMMAFFTGVVGGHKLYLGSTGGFIGFMVLLVVSISVHFPISFIAGIMQGLKLLRMSDQEFDRKYNRGFVAVRRGPLEARREAQMERFDQMPENGKFSKNMKPSPTATFRANPYKNSGIKKYKDFDLNDAIIDFNKGLEISPNDVALHFNIACAYSLTENKSKAYHHLSRAVSLGLKDVERILSHDDLAFVRIQPQFDAFRAGGFKNNPFEIATQKTGKADVPKPENIQLESDVLDDTLLAQLNKLSELRKKGVLSEDEFIFERKKVLRQ